MAYQQNNAKELTTQEVLDFLNGGNPGVKGETLRDLWNYINSLKNFKAS